jgi:hypothetical protein
LGLLNDGQNVAHSQNAIGHPFGIKGLKAINLF